LSTSSLATSLPWLQLVEPAPRLLVLPPDAVSLDEADAAIELWEFYKRRTLDPWQRLSVQLKLATRVDGRWAARTTGEEVPRQAGKGDAEEVVELWGLVQRAERILHTIHEAVLLATETHGRMLSLIEGHADLRRKKARAWSGTGQQMIEMRNGGIIWYRTRTGGGGRGVDEVDRVVIDEAQHAEPAHIEATSPTQLTSVNPQTNVMGTGGLPGRSAWWWSVRKRALSADPGEFAYLGFTAERLTLVDDHVVAERPDVSTVQQFMALVREVHPVLPRRPDLVGFFEEEYRKLGAEGASREYLLVWEPEPSSETSSEIPRWHELADPPNPKRDYPGSQVASNAQWALVVSPLELGPQWASFGLAGRRADGRFHVEALDHRAGTWWVKERAKQIYADKQIPLRMRATGPENGLIKQLREAGIEVEEVSANDASQAFGAFIAATTFDDEGQPQLHHLDDPDLNKAVKHAKRRSTSSGAASWDEVHSGVEITPLVAVTVALGGVPQVEPESWLYA
jgi:hypothetical protein